MKKNNSWGACFLYVALIPFQGIEPVRMDNLDQVLVHSADRINPITDLKDAPIGKLMREVTIVIISY